MIIMPGRDGTGPEGQGRLTGRKMGNCRRSSSDDSTHIMRFGRNSNNDDYGRGRMSGNRRRCRSIFNRSRRN